MDADNEALSAGRRKSRLLRAASWLAAAITVLSLVPSFGRFFIQVEHVHHWSADLSVGLGLAHWSLMVGLMIWQGRPRSGRECWILVTLNLWCVAAELLCGLRLWDETLALLLLIGVRLGVAWLWGYPLLGLPFVVRAMVKSPRGRKLSSNMVRLWLSTMCLLVTVEPIAEWLLHQNEVFQFPETIPDSANQQLRIVALGSSTMVGHPYEPKFGVPQVVAWRVQEMYPDREVVLENLAVSGQSLRTAILSLGRLSHRPHLVLLYSGHNEFMHRLEECGEDQPKPFAWVDTVLVYSPVFQFVSMNLSNLSIMRSFRDGLHNSFITAQITSPIIYEQRLRRFRNELTQLAQFGRRQNIPMLWYVPAASESGFQPNRSWVLPGTTAEEKRKLTQFWNETNLFAEQADWKEVVERCRMGLRRQPQFADFHFLLGESLLRLDQTPEAQQHFAQALDHDGHPLRMNHDYQRVIERVAKESGIVTVNGEAALRPHTPQGILDRSVIHDNVHPTFRGFFWLGLAGADRVFQTKLLSATFGEPRPLSDVTAMDAVRKFEIKASDVAVAYRRIANGLRWLSRLRFDPGRRLKEADEFEKWARMIETEEARPGERGIEPLD